MMFTLTFNVTNGMKQDGILSPVLYCVYTDDLLIELRNSGIGCYIGPYFYGALAYADDILLLCPSVIGAQEMLTICEDYADKHNIIFNAKKSQVIVMDKNKNKELLVSLYLKGVKLPVIHHAKHLGHTLSNMVSLIYHISVSYTHLTLPTKRIV